MEPALPSVSDKRVSNAYSRSFCSSGKEWSATVLSAMDKNNRSEDKFFHCDMVIRLGFSIRYKLLIPRCLTVMIAGAFELYHMRKPRQRNKNCQFSIRIAQSIALLIIPTEKIFAPHYEAWL